MKFDPEAYYLNSDDAVSYELEKPIPQFALTSTNILLAWSFVQLGSWWTIAKLPSRRRVSVPTLRLLSSEPVTPALELARKVDEVLEKYGNPIQCAALVSRRGKRLELILPFKFVMEDMGHDPDTIYVEITKQVLDCLPEN